jgi:hypothetical protein
MSRLPQPSLFTVVITTVAFVAAAVFQLLGLPGSVALAFACGLGLSPWIEDGVRWYQAHPNKAPK